jgi:hypothetical protein
VFNRAIERSERVIDSDVWDAPRSSEGAGKPEDPVLARGWASRAGLAIALLFSEYIFGWILFLSPGWANGWPFGIRFQTVLSVALTSWAFLAAMTAAAGAGAIVGFICALLGLGTKSGRWVYRIWLWTAAMAILCFSIPLFWRIHAVYMEVFPNGYLTP